MKSYWPLLPIAAVLAFGACDGGACGGEPAEKRGESHPASVSGGDAHGSGEVNIADWDSRRQSADAPPTQPQAPPADPKTTAKGPGQTAVPQPGKKDVLDSVGPADWDARVTTAKGPVLVMVTRDGCEDCALMRPVLRGLAPEFPKWTFLTSEGLPNVDKPPKPPTFVMYDQGKSASDRQGLPFHRSSGEKDKTYQERLSRWFRDALNEKNLKFSSK